MLKKSNLRHLFGGPAKKPESLEHDNVTEKRNEEQEISDQDVEPLHVLNNGHLSSEVVQDSPLNNVSIHQEKKSKFGILRTLKDRINATIEAINGQQQLHSQKQYGNVSNNLEDADSKECSKESTKKLFNFKTKYGKDAVAPATANVPKSDEAEIPAAAHWMHHTSSVPVTTAVVAVTSTPAHLSLSYNNITAPNSTSTPITVYSLPEVVLSSNQSLDKASNQLKISNLLLESTNIHVQNCDNLYSNNNSTLENHVLGSSYLTGSKEPSECISGHSAKAEAILNEQLLKHSARKDNNVYRNFAHTVAATVCDNSKISRTHALYSPEKVGLSENSENQIHLHAKYDSSYMQVNRPSVQYNSKKNKIITANSVHSILSPLPSTQSSEWKKLSSNCLVNTITPPTFHLEKINELQYSVNKSSTPLKITKNRGSNLLKTSSSHTALSASCKATFSQAGLSVASATKCLPQRSRPVTTPSKLPQIREDPIGGPVTSLTSHLELKSSRSWSQELKDILKYGWYWGPITRWDAEEKLSGSKDGMFLVRDSSDDNYLLSLSFRSQGKTFHTRIEHRNGKFSFSPQTENEGYHTLVELINTCIAQSSSGIFCYSKASKKGLPAFAVRLCTPLSRFSQVRSLQHMCRFTIHQHTRIDLIQLLPVPPRIKGFLDEKPY